MYVRLLHFPTEGNISGVSGVSSTSLARRQRGLIYTENKPLGRLSKSVTRSSMSSESFCRQMCSSYICYTVLLLYSAQRVFILTRGLTLIEVLLDIAEGEASLVMQGRAALARRAGSAELQATANSSCR